MPVALTVGHTTQLGQHDIQGLGNMFPYATALQLPGIHLLNVAVFPHISYCAWYQRSEGNPIYKQMIQPSVDNPQILAAYANCGSSLRNYRNSATGTCKLK
jgi:hypothetical protein